MTIWKLRVINGEDELHNVIVTLVMHSQGLYRFIQINEHMKRISVEAWYRLQITYMRMPIHSGSYVDDWVAVELHLFSWSDHA
jgi:hypothetical protein